MTRDQHPHDHDARGASERDPGARRVPAAEPIVPIPAGTSLDDEPALALDALRRVGGADTRTATRLGALAARIDVAAAPELARRAAASGARVLPLRATPTPPASGPSDDALLYLGRALRPALFAAAAALLVAVALGRGDASAPSAATEPLPSQLVAEATAEQALSVDAQDAEWIAGRRLPSDDEFVRAIAAGGER